MIALRADDELRAPAPGWFHLLVAADHLVAQGDVIGELEILGRTVRITAPAIRGLVKLPPGPSLARRAVAYGDVLMRVATDVSIGAVDPLHASGAAVTSGAHGLVFRAPTSGRFYGRPTPDKPPFVQAGAELASGTTVCLLEVMKTFHRVTYGGNDVPPRARVRDILVAEGADVNQGDALLALEPIRVTRLAPLAVLSAALVAACEKLPDRPDETTFRAMDDYEKCRVTASRAIMCTDELLAAQLRALTGSDGTAGVAELVEQDLAKDRQLPKQERTQNWDARNAIDKRLHVTR
jgi:acetyl-CoA carboxylase biotin carboxyl carrier protein